MTNIACARIKFIYIFLGLSFATFCTVTKFTDEEGSFFKVFRINFNTSHSLERYNQGCTSSQLIVIRRRAGERKKEKEEEEEEDGEGDEVGGMRFINDWGQGIHVTDMHK